MSGFGLIDFAEIFCNWVDGLSDIWDYLTSNTIFGVDLITVILGGGIVIYMGFVVAKWIIDFIP